jgi:hypothetical protein
METLYQAITGFFTDHPEVFTERELPVIRMIDIYMGQPDDPEAFEVFYPAIFINWSITPDNNGSGPHLLTLDFHVLQEPGKGTEGFSGVQDAGLQYVKLLKAVKYILNNLKADNCSFLQYAGERPAITPFFRYHVIIYQCHIDAYNDSLHRPAYAEGSLEKLVITEGKVKPIDPRPVTEIDTY